MPPGIPVIQELHFFKQRGNFLYLVHGNVGYRSIQRLHLPAKGGGIRLESASETRVQQIKHHARFTRHQTAQQRGFSRLPRTENKPNLSG
jgi:hypothetical protein